MTRKVTSLSVEGGHRCRNGSTGSPLTRCTSDPGPRPYCGASGFFIRPIRGGSLVTMEVFLVDSGGSAPTRMTTVREIMSRGVRLDGSTTGHTTSKPRPKTVTSKAFERESVRWPGCTSTICGGRSHSLPGSSLRNCQECVRCARAAPRPRSCRPPG